MGIFGKRYLSWLSKNNGKNFEAIHHFNEKVTSIEVAWSNPDVIYVATWSDWWGNKKIYRTNDAGVNWKDQKKTSVSGRTSGA